MNVLELTREVGKAIQADERYRKYEEARLANDGDEALQNLIGEFNMKRMQLNQEMSKTDKDNDKVSELNAGVRELYGKIMTNEHMLAYNDAKAEMDRLLDQINTVITASVNGEDPATCEAEHKCTGSCASCGGCH